jgi:hypothetical protein
LFEIAAQWPHVRGSQGVCGQGKPAIGGTRSAPTPCDADEAAHDCTDAVAAGGLTFCAVDRAPGKAESNMEVNNRVSAAMRNATARFYEND